MGLAPKGRAQPASDPSLLRAAVREPRTSGGLPGGQTHTSSAASRNELGTGSLRPRLGPTWDLTSPGRPGPQALYHTRKWGPNMIQNLHPHASPPAQALSSTSGGAQTCCPSWGAGTAAGDGASTQVTLSLQPLGGDPAGPCGPAKVSVSKQETLWAEEQKKKEKEKEFGLKRQPPLEGDQELLGRRHTRQPRTDHRSSHGEGNRPRDPNPTGPAPTPARMPALQRVHAEHRSHQTHRRGN